MAVQVALDVVDLGFHGGVGGEEQIGVAAEQVSHISGGAVGAMTHD